jgi:hypothetical protein
LAAVNTSDSDGKAIDASKLYARDFSSESWFQDAMAGKFLESKDKKCTGTVVEDLYVDESVRQIYGDEGLALGFSAPVRNAQGEIIAVWKNVAKFRLVEDIVYDCYRGLKERGLGSAELTLLDAKGNVIVDCDPTIRGTEDVTRDLAVIGKFNLADKGVEAAQRVVAGEAGSILYSWHAVRIHQVAGSRRSAAPWASRECPGSRWYGVSNEALATTNHLKASCLWTYSGAVGIILVAPLFSRSIGRVITKVISSMKPLPNDYGHRVTTT